MSGWPCPEIMSRRVPGHYWIRAGLSFTGNLEPGHRWMYHGIIRRDAWRIGPVGVFVLRMPKQPALPVQGGPDGCTTAR